MEAYPYSSDDMFSLKLQNVAQYTRAIHSTCFDLVALRDDVPFLTVKEGMQFRNCVTKISNWIPTLTANLKTSAFRHNIELMNAKHPEVSEDPWDKSDLLAAAQARHAAMII